MPLGSHIAIASLHSATESDPAVTADLFDDSVEEVSTRSPLKESAAHPADATAPTNTRHDTSQPTARIILSLSILASLTRGRIHDINAEIAFRRSSR